MHLHRIDLNLLVVLDAIFSEGGITKAGDKLHLTQPAISHALARLRDLFDDPLFVREGRAMVPTPLARSLEQPIRRTLRALEVTLNEVQQFDAASTQRHFSVAVRDVLEATVLPPLLARVAAAAPSIDISAIRADRRTLETELAAGTLDAALDVLLPLSDDIRHQRVSSDHQVVVLRRDHPLLQEAFDLAAYLRQHHVLVSSRRSGPTLEDIELSRHGLKRRIRLRCQHYFAACRVVSQTDLLLTMPAHYAELANQQFGNVVLPFPMEMPSLDVYLYWHASVDKEPASRWLREQVIATLAPYA
ncbi:LysR family transcriptional regulator [Sinimarinibacterium sp. CAU 1509]|uniref:LysR family transcriptional regulator n=1 Tax=Sinimarinibacterium sp. CAU 1509 TaxID=2562283 RepID=UPI0010AD0FBA|nr:LysR family transcriptional regulator [Sinimarinibacterium sp. CAU 1509]TJY59745.1 LysR family transcriptional regulator [Sinimarinibacterium sp. CAU 1509]